jgi:Tol biopolymer transport system component
MGDSHTPCWSHDGKWIYFASDQTGRNEIYKVAPQGGKPTQITRNGGYSPSESPDGKFIYFTKLKPGIDIWRIPAAGGTDEFVVELPSVASRKWVVTGKGIYFLNSEGHFGYVDFYDLSTKHISHVAKLTKPQDPIGNGMAMSPDGRYVLYCQLDQETSDLIIVENFK